MKCKQKGSDDLCFLCAHRDEHDPRAVWKEPDKKCSEDHKCEATGTIVRCEEKE